MGAQICWFAILALFFPFGQTANSLHNSYGSPTREEMPVRQGISVTVQYGRDLQVCELRIHPTTLSLLMNEPETPMMPELVTQILDELVPVGERGKGGRKTLISAGCNVLSVDEFKHVTISRATHECLPLQSAREQPAMVTFKKPECAEIEKAKLTQNK